MNQDMKNGTDGGKCTGAGGIAQLFQRCRRMTVSQKLILLGLLLGGCLLTGGSFVVRNFMVPVEWDGVPFEIAQVNRLDAALAHSYNYVLDNVADVLFVVANLLVLVCLFVTLFRAENKAEALSQFVYDGFVFGLAWLYTLGTYRLLKSFAGRIRPYMYFPNPSEKGVLEGDFCRSWPSGHSAGVSLAAGFLIAWLLARKLDAGLRRALSVAIVLICLATMTLRILSGNHFLTDVLSGGILGFTLSTVLFWLCDSVAGKDFA